MRNVILYTALSLDSYIARSDGEIDWLESAESIPGEDYGYKEFYDSVDTTLMGNNSYRKIISFDIPFPYPDKTNFVFSRSAGQQQTEFVQFISGDAIAFTEKLKKQNGKDIWLIGGGQVNSLLLSHQLIDRMILTIIRSHHGDRNPEIWASPLTSSGSATKNLNILMINLLLNNQQPVTCNLQLATSWLSKSDTHFTCEYVKEYKNGIIQLYYKTS